MGGGGILGDHISSPLGAGGRTFNLDVAQHNLISASNHFLMTPQHGFRTKAGFDRP